MTRMFASRFMLVSYMGGINFLALLVGLPLLPFFLFIRKRRKTLFRRLGFQRFPGSGKPTVKPIWVHALSVGELNSAIPLIKELRRKLPLRSLYLSVSTLAAHEAATQKIAGNIDGLFYFPYDLLLPVRRCLNRVRPALILLIETDIWPGFLAETRRLEIPCFLLNGRLSPATFRFSRFLSALFLPAYDTFMRVYPQSIEEEKRFHALGLHMEKMYCRGNLKFDLVAPLPSSEAIAEIRTSLGVREKDRVLLAGSTHAGEEAILRTAFLALRQIHPGTRLIIVPRHPKRAPEIAGLFSNDDFRTILFPRRSGVPADVIVVDRMGLLGGLYSVADIAFVGGSLVKKGGQNPIEPAAAGRPVLFGPDMSDFPEVSRLLLEKAGAIKVRNTNDLIETCSRLLAEPGLAAAVGMRARAVVDDHQDASRKIAEDIVAFLE